MKNKLHSLFMTGMLCAGALTSFGQAEIQIIHNSADPAAAIVDVYVNGTLALDDFEFREATPFIPLPSGTLLNIGVAPGNSTSVNDTLKNFEATLTAGQRYVALANGVLNPANFAANPGGASTGFTLFIQDNILNAAANAGDVDFIAVHGASDAPTVDVIARNVATLVNDASYSNITPYISVPPASYTLDVTPAAGSPIVATFTADLSTLGGGSAVVFASGFLNPASNQNGAAFGLFAALANGTVVAFPAASVARLQVIHNAADPAADSVDVYVNGNLLLNDFAFRTATPYIDVPAGVLLNIGVAGGNSASVNDTLKNFQVTLANGGEYLAVANGVLNPANFAANPDGAATAFTLFLQDQMREAATTTDVDFRVVHGASDAPTVDVIARNVATLVNDAAYSNITPYISVPPASYTLDVTPAAGSPIVATFTADLSTLGGGSAVVFASGFLNPASNQNGAAFGLFAALANGTVVAFPAASVARLQVIHNAADPAADSVDVYVNGNLLLNDFAFRTATPYIDVPAGVLLNIGVAAGNSTSVNDTLKNFQITLANGGEYLAVANGVLNPANFAANPDGAATAFTLFLQDQMRETATATDVDFRVVHGASDAPTVDVIARNVATLVNDASYSNVTPYISVPPASYTLDVTPAAGSPIVATFTADLSTLGGGSAVVFASGFLNPASNQNGAAFGLFAALANGTVVAFPAASVARLQVIHNAADPAAASVDVYVNGNLLLNDFAFRTATPYIDVPAGVLLNIGVAGGNSTSVNDTLKNFQVTLANGGEYLAVANGVLNPANFAANPDGAATAFTLFLQDQMREAATATDVDFRVVHGASDAPTVDVIARNVATLVNDASYSNITPYISVPPASYTLDVTPAAGSPIVATFTADLSTLGGGSAVVFASGFLNPASNQNGAAFGLFAALANGTVVAFPAASVARLQVIHNAADPAAASVDVYVNGNLLLNDFAFRTATPYIDVPAGVLLNIGVAGGNSASVNDTLKNFQVTLANGGEYLAVANGVLNPANFAANPDGAATAFTLFLQDQMREAASTATDVDFRVVHGASDAPTVDVLAGPSILVDNAAYTNITPYLTVPAANYTLDVTPGSNNSIIVASFDAPLTGLAGKSAVLLASGFLSPVANQNGPAFSILAVLADGTAFLLGTVTDITENDNSAAFNLYPNPSSDFIKIFPTSKTSNSTVEISNSLGQILKSESLINTAITIPVGDLSKGIYFVSVQNENGKTVSKLMVE